MKITAVLQWGLRNILGEMFLVNFQKDKILHSDII